MSQTHPTPGAMPAPEEAHMLNYPEALVPAAVAALFEFFGC